MADQSAVEILMEKNGWLFEETGGGCTAYTKADDGSWYWMITRMDDPSVPESMSDPITVGKYRLDTMDAVEMSDWPSLAYWAASHWMAE